MLNRFAGERRSPDKALYTNMKLWIKKVDKVEYKRALLASERSADKKEIEHMADKDYMDDSENKNNASKFSKISGATHRSRVTGQLSNKKKGGNNKVIPAHRGLTTKREDRKLAKSSAATDKTAKKLFIDDEFLLDNSALMVEEKKTSNPVKVRRSSRLNPAEATRSWRKKEEAGDDAVALTETKSKRGKKRKRWVNYFLEKKNPVHYWIQQNFY